MICCCSLVGGGACSEWLQEDITGGSPTVSFRGSFCPAPSTSTSTARASSHDPLKTIITGSAGTRGASVGTGSSCCPAVGSSQGSAGSVHPRKDMARSLWCHAATHTPNWTNASSLLPACVFVSTATPAGIYLNGSYWIALIHCSARGCPLTKAWIRWVRDRYMATSESEWAFWASRART